MADDGELLDATVPYYDAHGRKRFLRVSKATKRSIETIRRSYARACQRWERNEVALSVVGVEADSLVDPKTARVGFLNHDLEPGKQQERRRRGVNPWEGPRFEFARLIGEGRVWNGPPGLTADGRCELCGGRELGPHEACLGVCGRTGRDLDIPTPTQVELARLRKQEPREDDGLGGGKGKAPKVVSAKPGARAVPMK